MTVFMLDAAGPVVCLQDQLRRLSNDFFVGLASDTLFGTTRRRTCPAFNIWEDERSLYVEAEIPGARMDDIEILVTGDELTVKSNRSGREPGDANYHTRERRSGPFQRVMQLPFEVDAAKVEAGLRDGVLTITLPKAESVLPRKIEVKN